MFNTNLNNDCDSIDFDFFEDNSNEVKTYNSSNNSFCSKIITKAVIETSSRYSDAHDQPEDIININLNPNRNFEFDVNSHNIVEQAVNSRSSSGESLTNGKSVIKQDSFSILLDNINDITDESTTDSTITTISSDFTSVSPFSFVSDSSLESDISLDSIKNENTMSNELLNCNFNDNSNNNNNNDIVYDKIDSYEDEETKKETSKDNFLNHTSTNPDVINKSTTNNTNDNKTTELEYYSATERDFCKNSTTTIITESIICATEEKLKNLSFSPQSNSTPFSVSTPSMRESSKIQLKKKKFNLTFNREELIKIERDNLTLLKKIMAYSKPRTISNNHTFNHRKTSAAINRAKLQKQIDQDNYILFSKINAMSRMKNIC